MTESTQPIERKWTGGMWFKAWQGSRWSIISQSGVGTHKLLATTHISNDAEDKANAHIFAAAPKLFEELKTSSILLDTVLSVLDPGARVGLVREIQMKCKANQATLRAALGEGE